MLPSLLLAALPLAAATPWAQPADSPVYGLFKRQDPGAANYPPPLAVPTNIPQAWLDKLKAVEGEIRNIPVAAERPGDPNAVDYPNSTLTADLADKTKICHYATGCWADDDIRDGPNGTFMITFDDGPGDGTTMLSDFLESKNVSTHATHFMIGASIVNDTAGYHKVFDRGGHIASHTWSHKRSTTLKNEEIVAELGWTMQAIADNSGGRLPLFWRPPYGDLDNRVRDVAKKVFGLETVVWNSDSNDWKIATQGKNGTEAEFEKWVVKSKNPGINALMHEINTGTVEIFIDKFDKFTNAGWKIQSVAEATGKGMYFNAADNFATVTNMTINDLGAHGPSGTPSTGGNATTTGGTDNTNASGSGGTAAPPAATAGNNGASGIVAPIVTVLFASLFAAFL